MGVITLSSYISIKLPKSATYFCYQCLITWKDTMYISDDILYRMSPNEI